MKVLVVAAHPDDEVLGCGGTIARLASEGHEVHISILGEGMTSRFKRREDADPALLEDLRRRCRDAGLALGARDVTLRDFPDNRFDAVPLLDLVKAVEDLCERVSPRVIYTHHAGDLNADHGLTHRAVLTATRPVEGLTVREIYAFEVPSSTEWAFGRLEPVFRPNVFVDIASTLDAKLEALSHYESEVRRFPHPRSPEALRAIAARWGSVAGCGAAEAFELVRALR